MRSVPFWVLWNMVTLLNISKLLKKKQILYVDFDNHHLDTHPPNHGTDSPYSNRNYHHTYLHTFSIKMSPPCPSGGGFIVFFLPDDNHSSIAMAPLRADVLRIYYVLFFIIINISLPPRRFFPLTTSPLFAAPSWSVFMKISWLFIAEISSVLKFI